MVIDAGNVRTRALEGKITGRDNLPLQNENIILRSLHTAHIVQVDSGERISMPRKKRASQKEELQPCGKRLAALRAEKNKTQAQVAKETGLSLSAIQKYESNVRRPSDRHKVVLARYYGKSVADLFFGSFSVDK